MSDFEHLVDTHNNNANNNDNNINKSKNKFENITTSFFKLNANKFEQNVKENKNKRSEKYISGSFRCY